MGIMAERLDAVVARAASPDGLIASTYSDTAGAVVRFRDDSFPRYTEHALGHQLGRLATRLWANYRHCRQQVVSEVSGCPIPTKEEFWDAKRRRFRTELAEAVSEGMSTDEFVYIQNTGMLTWNVVIRDGALATLTEEAFTAEFESSHRALLRDYHEKHAELRHKHFSDELQTAN